MMEAAKGFRRLKARDQLPTLRDEAAAIADHQAAYGNREEFNSAASTLAEVYFAECDRHAVTAASARRRSGNDSAAGGQRSTRAGSAKKNFVGRKLYFKV